MLALSLITTKGSIRGRLIPAAVGLSWMFTLSGCSIVMALNGHREPNFDNIQVGATREQVELEFGKPTSTKELEGGKREESYRYELGNSPNPARASVYGYAYLTIIGILGEPIYTLIEALQGHDEETRVVFGADNRVLDITGYRPPPPSRSLQAAQEEQGKFSRKEVASTSAQQASRISIEAQLRDLAHLLSTNMSAQGITRVAVLPVQDASGKENVPFGNYLTEKLTAKLHEEGTAKVVERSQLARVTQELALSHSGSFDESSAMRIGSLLGVEAVVTSFYADLGHLNIEVNSKVVRVQTGEIIAVGTAEIPRAAVEHLLH